MILDHLGGFGMVFRFLKSESFSKRSYTPKSVAFGRIRGFSKRLIFLNSVLDTQNDLKPTIIQYNICCTYKKRQDYVVRRKKSERGGQGGQGGVQGVSGVKGDVSGVRGSQGARPGVPGGQEGC